VVIASILVVITFFSVAQSVSPHTLDRVILESKFSSHRSFSS
jgi:hypothetical protein